MMSIVLINNHILSLPIDLKLLTIVQIIFKPGLERTIPVLKNDVTYFIQKELSLHSESLFLHFKLRNNKDRLILLFCFAIFLFRILEFSP